MFGQVFFFSLVEFVCFVLFIFSKKYPKEDTENNSGGFLFFFFFFLKQPLIAELFLFPLYPETATKIPVALCFVFYLGPPPLGSKKNNFFVIFVGGGFLKVEQATGQISKTHLFFYFRLFLQKREKKCLFRRQKLVVKTNSHFFLISGFLVWSFFFGPPRWKGRTFFF